MKLIYSVAPLLLILVGFTSPSLAQSIGSRAIKPAVSQSKPAVSQSAAGSAGGVTYGAAGGTAIYRNVFGWKVGSVTSSWDYVCVDCSCAFVGAPTVSESLPIQACEIINISTSPTNCPSSSACGPSVGQKTVLVIECCTVAIDVFGVLCASHQEILYACP